MNISNKLLNIINQLEDLDRQSELQMLLGKNYTFIIDQLKGGANDEKTLAAIRSGLQDGSLSDDKMTIKSLVIKVSSLQPCQHNKTSLNL